MFGLLQRLHKLHIQEELHSKCEKESHGIIFPRLEKYGKGKEGCSTLHSPCYKDISNETIEETLNTAVLKANETVEKLGMMDSLKALKFWDVLPLAVHLTASKKGNDDCESDEEENEDEFVTELDPVIMNDIEKLCENQVIHIVSQLKKT